MVSSIVIISPYDEFTEKIKSIVSEMNEHIDVYTGLFDEAVSLCEKLKKQGARVFISRGGNTKYIQDKIDLPVVDIAHNLGDYLDAIKKAKEIKGKIGIFQYNKKLEDIDTVSRLIDIDMKQYIFCGDETEADQSVKDAIKDGIVLGIGGTLTEMYCRKNNINYIRVNSSKDSIINAINTAKEVYNIQEEEKKKSDEYKIQMEKYEAVLNFSYNGIIGIDENYKINVFNPCAEELMNMSSKEMIGKNINAVMPNSKLANILKTGKTDINKLTKINNKHITINRIPIYGNNEIKGAVATFQDIRKIQENEREIRRKLANKGLVAKYSFDDVLSDSQVMKQCINIAKGYAKTSSTILVYGETGTGKELFAQSIHNYSLRRSAPFVAINCAALPESILESELFGYEEGTFTGGKKGGKLGLFELAHEGTIFLDEIAEIPLALQAQLLRVLQEKQIRRLGSDKIIPIDVRVIAATNKNLAKEVKKDRFRQDLFYRINILRLILPPLRERKEDIEKIGVCFIKSKNYKLYSKNQEKWNEIFKLLSNYDWHGNVRELENVLERTMVILKENIYTFDNYKELLGNVLNSEIESMDILENKYISIEKQKIIDVLEDSNWSKTKAAKKLGMSRTTLWRKMKDYGIGT